MMRDGCQMSWNYFSSGHGKEEVDGAGAFLKRKIRNEQLKPRGLKLQNVAEIVQFFEDQFQRVPAGLPGARRITHNFFWEIPKMGPGCVDRSDPRQCERVPGSMSNHQCRSISARDPTLVQFCALSCFCHVFLSYSSEHACHQSAHVQEFTLYRLKPKAPGQVRRLYDGDEEVEAGSGGELIADALSVRGNMAMRAPLEDEPYWLMLVVKPTHIVHEPFIDQEGNSYGPGDVVFGGFWYERLREGSQTYLLRNDKEPSFVYSHVVLTAKFSLPPIMHGIKSRFSGFELTLEVKEIIDCRNTG
jgi:hypothetical protein